MKFLDPSIPVSFLPQLNDHHRQEASKELGKGRGWDAMDEPSAYETRQRRLFRRFWPLSRRRNWPPMFVNSLPWLSGQRLEYRVVLSNNQAVCIHRNCRQPGEYRGNRLNAVSTESAPSNSIFLEQHGGQPVAIGVYEIHRYADLFDFFGYQDNPIKQPSRSKYLF